MKIIFNPAHNAQEINSYNKKNNLHSKQKELSLNNEKDYVSFKGMPLSFFKGYDIPLISRLKIPIENMHSYSQFLRWVDNALNQLGEKSYPSFSYNIAYERANIIKKWKKNIQFRCNPQVQLFVLTSITEGLNASNSKIPPLYHPSVFYDSIFCYNSKLNFAHNFNEIYNQQLINQTLNGIAPVNFPVNKTGWIVIPSKRTNSSNFSENCKNLKILSKEHWFGSYYEAKDALKTNDMHIHIKDGQPNVLLFVNNGRVMNVLDRYNGAAYEVKALSPLNYDIVNTYISGMKQDILCKYYMDDGLKNKKEFEMILSTFKKPPADCSSEEIFNTLGIKTYVEPSGKLKISEYRQPSIKLNQNGIKYEDLGIDENKLLNDVISIDGNADFSLSDAYTTGSVENVGGTLIAKHSKIKSLNNIKNVNNLILTDSNVIDLGKLENVSENVEITSSNFNNNDFRNINVGGNLSYRSYPNTFDDVSKAEVILHRTFKELARAITQHL